MTEEQQERRARWARRGRKAGRRVPVLAVVILRLALLIREMLR